MSVPLLTLVTIQGQQSFDLRAFDESGMSAFAEQQAFDYMNYTVQPPSIWERLGWWLQSLFQEIFLNPNTPWLTQIAYYLILLLVLGAAIFYIIRLRYGGALAPDYRSFQSGMAGTDQTRAEDFDQMIGEALEGNNYRLAIRYLYLKSLASLAKKGLISLKDWKTPYDYERELEGGMTSPYREMARLFEYVWYGDFDAGANEYQRGTELFSQLEQAT